MFFPALLHSTFLQAGQFAFLCIYAWSNKALKRFSNETGSLLKKRLFLLLRKPPAYYMLRGPCKAKKGKKVAGKSNWMDAGRV